MKKSSINKRISRLRRFNADRFLRVDLTTKNHLEVLYLLGKFGEMTSTEIRHKMSVINQSRYTYELLEDLHPPAEKRMRLFVWEEFTRSNLKELFPLLYPLAEPFWKISECDLDNIDVTIDVTISEEKITFSYGEEKKIIIDRSGEKPFVRVYIKEEPCRGEPLIIQTKKNKSHVYMELGFDRRLNYVDHYYDSNDRKVYALNILGFLLLISNSKIIGLEKLRSYFKSEYCQSCSLP